MPAKKRIVIGEKEKKEEPLEEISGLGYEGKMHKDNLNQKKEVAVEAPEEKHPLIEEKREAEVVEEVKEVEEEVKVEKGRFDKEAWKPKTSIGEKVKKGEIKDIDEILDNGLKILESEIVDILMPDLETDLLLCGQSKGKFGGGKRRVFKQTQKKTAEGNKIKFATFAVVGNRNGYVGVGYGKSKETVPAREKAIRNAKLSIMKIRRGCGSWECSCKEPHSIPLAVKGKVGSVVVKLIPAPKGSGLVVHDECGKILAMAGIKDVWSKTLGKTTSRGNVILALLKALQKIIDTKIAEEEKFGIIEGRIKND